MSRANTMLSQWIGLNPKQAMLCKGLVVLSSTKHIYNDVETSESRHLITANNIWVEFTSTIRARLNHIKAKANWWTYRDAVQLVPKAIVEQSILLALLPDWEHLGSSKAVTLDKLHLVHRGSGSYTLPPLHIPRLIPTGRYGPLPNQREMAR
jgi:hypothetical protein